MADIWGPSRPLIVDTKLALTGPSTSTDLRLGVSVLEQSIETRISDIRDLINLREGTSNC
jgi:hypothetical protein